jgi:hypothetical protein
MLTETRTRNHYILYTRKVALVNPNKWILEIDFITFKFGFSKPFLDEPLLVFYKYSKILVAS